MGRGVIKMIMNNLRLNKNEIGRWFRDRGDYTHNITYDINKDSVVMDLGGYTGVWAQQIIDKYDPNMYIIEPIENFYNGMVERFKDNDKVHLLNVGISTKNKTDKLFLSNDGTSSNINGGESIDVEFNTMNKVLDIWDLTEVDLLQVNIEGDEYPLLESMLENGIINKFKNIQIQFHLGIDNDIERRENIRKGLMNNGFNIKFDYPFVWESWTKSVV
jgi:FkbM family methyltransferase